jgi:hypothetical protein
MASINNTVNLNKGTDGATHAQADGAFTIAVNYALGSHQIHAYTDVTPTAGTLAVEYEVADGNYLEVKDSGTPVVVDLTNPEAFDINVHTESFRFTPTGLDADKFAGVRIYTKNTVA